MHHGIQIFGIRGVPPLFPKGRDHIGHLHVDMRIRLKWTIEKLGVHMSASFSCMGVGISVAMIEEDVVLLCWVISS